MESVPSQESELPLPRELIRDIFEIAARENRGDALRIVLCSRMAQAWLDPLIYEMVSVGGNCGAPLLKFLFTFKAKPPSFFAKHVKGLYLCDPFPLSDALEMVGTCTRIEYLSLWGTSGPALEIAHFLRLKRLCAPVGCVRKICADSRFRATLAGVTHLDLNDLHEIPTYDLRPVALDTFSALTHVAFMVVQDSDLAHHLVILLECSGLQCLVLLSAREEVEQHEHALKKANIDDARVVVLPTCPDEAKNWEAHRKGVSDFWTEAGEVLQTRMPKRAS